VDLHVKVFFVDSCNYRLVYLICVHVFMFVILLVMLVFVVDLTTRNKII
jgi:hypothetical protein